MKTKKPKLKKGAWFYRVRGSYLPATWQGWLTYIPFVGFLVWTLSWGINSNKTVAEAALLIFPSWIASAAAMTWLAKQKS
jgi:hypothetical protein